MPKNPLALVAAAACLVCVATPPKARAQAEPEPSTSSALTSRAVTPDAASVGLPSEQPEVGEQGLVATRHNELTTQAPPAESAGAEAGDEASDEGEGPLQFEPGRGLQLTSDDERFSVNIRGRIQILGQLDVGRDDATGGYAEPSFDLSFRRARVALAGHAFDADTRFKVEFAFSDRDMGRRDGVPTFTPLLDYYVELLHVRDLNVRLGQFKVPFSRERVISSSRLSMVDRSIVNSELNVDRDFGLSLSSRDLFGLGLLRYYAGVYVGEGRDWVPGQGRDDTGFLYTGRVEFLPFGLFDDYAEGDHERNDEARLSLGLAYAFLDEAGGNRGIRGSAPADGGTTDYHFVAADALLMYGGLSLQTELIFREGTRNAGDALDEDGVQVPVEAARTGIGWFLEAGYLLPEVNFQVNARYGITTPLGPEANTSMPERNELGLGLAYYFDEHTYKVQLDAFHLWGEVAEIGRGEERVRLSIQAFL